MLELIKYVLIRLLCFGGSLATKCVFLRNKLYMTRSTHFDLNPVRLNYYLFMISQGKYNGSCNAVDDISRKIWVASKTKYVNI